MRPQSIVAGDFQYPDSHWGVSGNRVNRSGTPLAVEDPFRICVLWWGLGQASDRIPVVVKLNPTDARGYRLLCTVSHLDDPRCTFNRLPAAEESVALSSALSFLALRVFPSHLGLIGQFCFAGNNAHGFITKNVVCGAGDSSEPTSDQDKPRDPQPVALGTHEEMHLIHGHVIGRGDPDHCFVAGVPLRGPPPGEEFCMRSGKVVWAEADARSVVGAIRAAIDACDSGELSVFSLSVDSSPPWGQAPS